MADPGSSAAAYLQQGGYALTPTYTQPMQGGSASATNSRPSSDMLNQTQGFSTAMTGGSASAVTTSSGLQVNPQTGTAFDPNTQSTYDATGRKVSGNGPATNNEASQVIRDVITNTNRNVVNNNNEVTNQNQVLNRTAVTTETGQTNITGQNVNQSSGQRNVSSNQTGSTNLTGSSRTYLDIPTPEQFLDDFQNGFATYVSGLHLGMAETSWVQENMSLFLNEYIGELGKMAQRGEPVFKPTDIKDDAYYLGSRAGEVSSTRQQGSTNTQTNEQGGTSTQSSGQTNQSGVQQSVGNQQTVGRTETSQQQQNQQAIEEAMQSAINASGNNGSASSQQTNQQDNSLINTQTNSAGLANENNALNTNEQQFSNQQTNRNVNTLDLSNANTNETGTRDLNQNVNMGEDVYGRSAAGYVHTLAPMDFLGSKFSAGDMELLFQGRKGARQASGRSGGTLSGRLIS